MNGGIAFESLSLYGACPYYALTDGSAAFASRCFVEVFEGNGGYFNLDIDAVEQRTADTAQVFLHLAGRAGAGVGGVVVVSAGAGVHAGH